VSVTIRTGQIHLTAMRIACLKHVEYEGPAYFPDWATRQGHVIEEFLVPESGLPEAGDHARVIIIGGPMSVWETDRHPWLIEEKRLIAELLSSQTPVLGICLGAQLLAEQLGATVTPGEHKEIGWFDVDATEEARSTWLGDALPARFKSFMWHGDFFELPSSAVPVAANAAHDVQGFLHGSNLGLQFHLEATPAWTRRLLQRDGHELVAGPFIQTGKEIASAPPGHYSVNNRLLDRVMDRWLGLAPATRTEVLLNQQPGIST